jgi:hypothetical protein
MPRRSVRSCSTSGRWFGRCPRGNARPLSCTTTWINPSARSATRIGESAVKNALHKARGTLPSTRATCSLGMRRIGGEPVDGTGRLGAGQRRRGERQLDPRARAALAPALRHQGPGPPGDRPLRRRLQPPATPQQLRHARPCRLRASPCRASHQSSPTGPGRVKPSPGIGSGALGPTEWHPSAGDSEAQSAISSPPRNGGSPPAVPFVQATGASFVRRSGAWSS